ncbi:cyclic nucleotide-binding domain-containing protein [bacterium]|nr:cyclic nucleotide-binding domain-containing protein [bacterium]
MPSILHIPAGQVIYRKGSTDFQAYVLKKGKVLLTLGDDSIRQVSPINIFGEAGWFQQPKNCDATAVEDCELEVIGRDEVELFFQQNTPEWQLALHALMQRMVGQPEAAKKASEHDVHEGQAAMTQVGQALQGIQQLLKQASQNEDISPNVAHFMSSTSIGELKPDELGPLQPFHEDDSVNDILVNGTHSVFVERHGKLEDTGFRFNSDEEVLAIADKIVSKIGRRLDPHRPMVDARLIDGSRVNVIAPPLAVDGPTISIRKFSRRGISLDKMQEQGNVSAQLAEFLKIAGLCRMNVLISGGTGSGKTTLLNAIAQHIDPAERIVTVEDAAELQLRQPHVVRLETKPLSTRGRIEDEVSMRDLVKNALRMRPDRIIVGEVRGAEAYDMMQAMNTGHEGSMSTIHANHPRDALSRLENMITLNNPNFTLRAIRAQIASALHLIIQVSRMRDGHRRIIYITEVCGVEGDVITMQDLFTFNVTGETKQGRLHGDFVWTGIMPKTLRRIAYYGMYEKLGNILGVKLPKL